MTARVLLVGGGPAPLSSTERMLQFAARELQTLGHPSDTLLLRSLPSEPLLHGRHRHPALLETTAMVERADAIVVAGPVYKRSIPGLLKCWLDVLPRFGLRGKHLLPITSARYADDVAGFAVALRAVAESMGVHTVHPVLAELRPEPRTSRPVLVAPQGITGSEAPVVEAVRRLVFGLGEAIPTVSHQSSERLDPCTVSISA